MAVMRTRVACLVIGSMSISMSRFSARAKIVSPVSNLLVLSSARPMRSSAAIEALFTAATGAVKVREATPSML